VRFHVVGAGEAAITQTSDVRALSLLHVPTSPNPGATRVANNSDQFIASLSVSRRRSRSGSRNRSRSRPCSHRSRLVSSGWSMSALPPKADIRQRVQYVCFVPKADTARWNTGSPARRPKSRNPPWRGPARPVWALLPGRCADCDR
jgi:hypothetical protein